MAAITIACSHVPATADFQRWSVDREQDPFSGGEKVAVNYMSSMRSGVFVFCDTSERGLMVRAIPGFANEPQLAGLTPIIAFAFDGELLLSDVGQTGSVGDNLAISQVMLKPDNAQKFVDAFAKAKKQIAIKDGISDSPHLLKASGSTAAGESLVACMAKQ